MQCVWQSVFFRNGVWAAQIWAVRHGCTINLNILLNIVWVCKSGAHGFLCRGAAGVSEGDTCLDCIELKTCNQEPLNSGAAPPQTFCKTRIKSKCNNIKSYFQLDVCCIMLETPLQPVQVCFPPNPVNFWELLFFSPPFTDELWHLMHLTSIWCIIF